MTISTIVTKQRIVRVWMIEKLRGLNWCEVCGNVITMPHVYLYAGYPKPYRSHICLKCSQLEGIAPQIKAVADEYINRIKAKEAEQLKSN